MKWQQPTPGQSRLWRALRGTEGAPPFERLVPLTWRGELLLFCALMLLSFLVAGFWYPYWRVADMDFWVVYNAFLLNVPLPQEFFDHPGYLSILLLSYWLRAPHSLGIVHVISLNALVPVSDAAAFAQAWAAATRAGRVLSLIYAMSFVAAFGYLLRALLRDWRIAAFGAFLLAFSGGMAMEMRTLRTELLATGFFMNALMMLLVMARAGERWWRPAVIGCASMLIALAIQNKVQVFFLICALPVLVLPFGPSAAGQRGFWSEPRCAWPALVVAVALAVLAGYLAKDIVTLGLTATETATMQLPPLGFGARIYWPVIAGWLALGMLAYAAIWKVAPLEMLASAAAVVAGCMFGLLALDIRFHPNDVLVVFHPLEQMLMWATASQPQLAEHGSFFNSDRLKFLVEAIAGVIARRTFVLASSPRPGIFLEWFIIAATVIAIRRRRWKLVLQVAVLMLTDCGIDTLSMARGLKPEYFLFTDPLAIIAAALLVAKLTDLQRHRWTYPVGATLIAAHLVVSQAEPVKHLFRTEGPDVLCGLYGNAQRVERLPICATR